jgi:hypothetical protein
LKFIAGCLFYFVGAIAVLALALVSCRPSDELGVSAAAVLIWAAFKQRDKAADFVHDAK